MAEIKDTEADFDDVVQDGAQSEGEDELYEHYRFVADKGQEPLRIDRYLVGFIQNATRNKVQNAIRSGSVLVGDVPVKPNYKVKPNDVIRVVLPTPVREGLIIPQDIPLDIVYEDADLIVVNKPAGMVVHPGHGNYSGTLVNALAYHFEHFPTAGAMERPGLVHRIDKDTSGLLVVAKTEYAMTHLARQFFDHSIKRRYKALVWGDFEENEGTYRGNIARNPADRMQMTVFPDGGEVGKPAVTHYRVVQRFGYVTLVECKLETGRTHQIRAHFTFNKHPLFSDERYGGHQILKGTTSGSYKLFIKNAMDTLPRQALHAEILGFVHPTTGEKMEFSTPMPYDMSTAISMWEQYAQESMKSRMR
ncbi:MAG: RluA family pseudouridine synthase [Flavobacteriales bacterium]|nr:RluA family pseudouridine synthase [Flavobacteriales bacterium]